MLKSVVLVYSFSITARKARLFPHLTKKPLPPARVYPNQYPTQLSDPQPSMISKQRPKRFLTPKDEVVQQCDVPQHMLLAKRSPQSFPPTASSYSMKIGVFGPTNSGKSSLVGRLAHKISAVSAKAHTTSEVVNVVKSYQVDSELGLKNVQLNYFDAPGLVSHKGGFLSRNWDIIKDIDFALLVLDSNKRFEEGVRVSIERLEKGRDPSAETPLLKALVLNKIDLVNSRNRFSNLIAQIERYGKFDRIFYTSCQTDFGVKQLQQYLVQMAPKGVFEYPTQTKTTLTEREVLEEMMKEAVYSRTYEEVPHQTLIECQSVARQSNGKDYLKFKISVLDENQRRLMIGKEGKNLEEIKKIFLLQYAKTKSASVDLVMQISIMNAYKRKVEIQHESVVSEKHHVDEAKKDIKELQEKTKRKLSITK